MYFILPMPKNSTALHVDIIVSYMEFKLLKGSEKIMEIHFLIVNMRNFRPNGFKIILSKLTTKLGVETKSLYPAA